MEDFTRRIVILGKTGAGKSSLSNTLLGETAFVVSHSPKSGTITCEAKTKLVNEKSITLIDTPGLFDTERPEEEMKAEILKCLVECAPGPHAFIIVLKVEKYTKQEKEIIKMITEYFEDDALKFAIVLFTHGDQLSEGEKIEEFVSQSKDLSHLVEKCGNRCHVIDNKYWKNSEDDYRNNQFQVKELLDTLDKIKANNGGYYTNEFLEALLREIEKEKESIQLLSPNFSPEEVTEKAKSSVFVNLMSKASELPLSTMLGAFFGGAMAFVSKQGVGRSGALFLTLALGLATGAAAVALVRSASVVDEAKADETRVEEAGQEEENAENLQTSKSTDQTPTDQTTEEHLN